MTRRNLTRLRPLAEKTTGIDPVFAAAYKRGAYTLEHARQQRALIYGERLRSSLFAADIAACAETNN